MSNLNVRVSEKEVRDLIDLFTSIKNYEDRQQIISLSRSLSCIYTKKLISKIQYYNEYLPSVNIDEINKGIDTAKKYHGSQMRKSDEPYYSHPIEVACLFIDYTAHSKPALHY